jgi:hypothetical protein
MADIFHSFRDDHKGLSQSYYLRGMQGDDPG